MGTEVTQDGRLWAILSYAGFFVGLPIAVVPLAQRKDDFALFHAKHAMGVFVGFLVFYFGVFALAFLLFFVTCGLSNFVVIPVLGASLLWPLVTSIHGLVLASDGRFEAPFGSFGLGERLFGTLRVETAPQVTSAEPPPES